MPAARSLREALADRTEALCAVRSPIGHEAQLCDELERWARERCASVRRVKNSLVVDVDEALAPVARSAVAPADRGPAAGRAPGGRPIVALCGHLDTVPIHPGDEGRFPRREGGRLFAPGASDMKGGVALALEAAERIRREHRVCDLVLVLYSREEGPFEENELGDVLAAVPELARCSLAFCLEPTDSVLQAGCVGSIHATVAFEGRAAHSARPWQGENAIHKAGAFLAHLAGQPPRDAVSGGLTFREVMSATRIEGGRARNVVPDRCTVNVNFRFAPDRALDGAVEELLTLVRRYGGTAEITDRAPACPAYVDHALVKRFVERAGVRVEPKQAWTDVARLAAAGIPAVNFGPGATAQAHQVGEWVELDALERCYGMLERFLRP